ncbi:hypothetical protein PhCBS80983_g02026 [Powellomyces hirtus]|uniref:precorrin-2 dehydrogenase n=1 Tax=Powellomyces hirtus TaxID=109895 RepID=A0A507EAR7_9FUNG|nr:hypothetical protein PhCBS80983_g02026 [Powellomyces hirtus]
MMGQPTLKDDGVVPPARGGASLILAWNIPGKNVLVLGSNEIAAQRVLYALEADAHVSVVLTKEDSPVSPALQSRISRGDVTFHSRAFSDKDLENKSLVMVANHTDPALARYVATLCRHRRIPVNVADAPDLSDFWFMSTYRDHALQVAVSTNGSGPKIATKLRQRIADTLPADAGLAIENLAAVRNHLRAATAFNDDDHARRLAFVSRLSESWTFEELAKLTLTDIEKIGDIYRNGGDYVAPPRGSTTPASVASLQYIVAGGDPDLLTRGAYNSLSSAAVVVADSAVPQDILDIVSGHLVVLKKGQSQIMDTVLPALQRDRGTVVRLVAGEGALPTSVTEEIAFFRETGYKVRVFPSAAPLEHAPAALTKQLSEPSVFAAAETHASATFKALPVIAPSHGRIGTVRQVDGITAAAHVAYALSDLSFIYPVSTAGDVGRVMQNWADANTLNAFGKCHKVVPMSTRSGAASAVHGALSTGSAVTAVLSSEALTLMIPSMYEIARSKQPVVFHVAAQTLGPDAFDLVPDISHVVAASYTGFALLGSASVQESHDLALVAHVAARWARTPVLHFLDGTRVAREISTSKLVDYDQLKSLVHPGKAATGDVVSAIDAAMKALEESFGQRYRLFQYSGAADAETVVVALGPAAALAHQSAAKIGGKVGVLNVRLLRPWSAQHFIEALPKSVKKLVVVEQSGSNGSGHGPLFLDVTACFYTQAWTGPTPVVLSGRFATDSASFHPAAVEALLRNALSARPDFEFVMSAEKHVTTDRDAPYQSTGVNQAVLWDLQETHTAHATEDILGYIASAGQSVQSYTAHGDAQIDPVSTSYIRYSNNVEVPPAPHLIHSAQYAAVHDLSLLKRYNVARSVARGGILLLNTHLAGADLLKEIPDAVRREIATRNLRVKMVDADGVARNWTLFKGKATEYVKLILTAVFLKLAPEMDFARGIKELGTKIVQTEPDRSILATKLGAVQRALASIHDVSITAPEQAACPDEEQLPRHVGNSINFPKLALSDAEDSDPTGRVVPRHEAIWPALFPETYHTAKNLRPDVEGAFKVTVTENRRVTPLDYDRNVFHMEMDIRNTGLKYEIGEALGVHGHNDPEAVQVFLNEYGLNGDDVVVVERGDKAGTEVRTVSQMFTQVLDVFGKPGRKFYQALLPFSGPHHAALYDLISDADAMQTYVDEETPTYADLLLQFTNPATRPTANELLALIPAIKPRHYSISSAQSMHPDSVHLLVVLVDWTTKKSNASRFGHCTRYLLNAPIGTQITVTVKPSVMKLPPSMAAPVIMAGLGTGMAPFRAFVQERAYWKSKGKHVGPMSLYFGSRHRTMEFLYGEEMEAYHADGVLTHLRTAFSRDQREKIYIQHRIQQDGEVLKEWMVDDHHNVKQDTINNTNELANVTAGGGAFYLCGPTWPVPDVRDALLSAFKGDGHMTQERAEEYLEELKETERYVLEVY